MPSLVRHYSRSERIADGVIHILGVVLGLVACAALAVVALPRGGLQQLISLGLYAAGLMAMFGCSTLYNLTDGVSAKRIFRRLDHTAIFVMIAGTYTPFALISIGGAWGIGLLAFVWAVALGGAALKLTCPHRFERLSIATYLLLGWSVVVALEPLVAAVSLPGLILLATGGLLYSLGVVFHLWNSLRYQNAIWHGFVLAGAACHYAAVLGDVAVGA